MDCSLPDSSVHGIFQSRILKWVAIPFSRGYSWPSDWTHVSCVYCIGGWTLYHGTTWETPEMGDYFFKCYQSICWSLRIHMLLPYFPAPLFLNRRWCVSQLGWNIEKSVCSLPGLFQFLSSCYRKPGRHTLRWQGHTVKQAVSTSSCLEEGCPRGATISQWIRPDQDIKVEVLSHWEFRIHLLLQQNDPILTSYIDSFHLLKDINIKERKGFHHFCSYLHSQNAEWINGNLYKTKSK